VAYTWDVLKSTMVIQTVWLI